jgi:hypothetical protein
MYRFQNNIRIDLKIFAKLGHEYIHASAQK